MDIFESLENLNVSEECFDDIIGIVEEILNELYEKGYEAAPKGHKHKVGDEVQVSFGAGLSSGKSGKISSLYKSHTGSTWAKGTGADGEFDVPTPYLRTKKKEVAEALVSDIIDVVEELLSEDTVSYIKKKVEPLVKQGLEDVRGKLSSENQKKLDDGKNIDKELIASMSDKVGKEIQKYNELKKKAQDARMKGSDLQSHKSTKAEKGAEKTEERRWGEKNIDYSGLGDHIVGYHKGSAKGYPHNVTPKSDEQRVKDSIERHDKKENK